MSSENRQVYGLSEAQYFGLYQAEHLTKLLMTIAERRTDENPLLNQLESESFCVVMGLIRDLISTDAITAIENHQA